MGRAAPATLGCWIRWKPSLEVVRPWSANPMSGGEFARPGAIRRYLRRKAIDPPIGIGNDRVLSLDIYTVCYELTDVAAECPNCAGLVVVSEVLGELWETCSRDCGWWRRVR